MQTGEEVAAARASPREAAEIWSQVLAELRPQVSAANYRTWLAGTTGLGYHHPDFIIGVNSFLVAEHLHAAMRSLLEKTLIQVSGRRFGIAFVCGENNAGQEVTKPEALIS